MQKKRRRSYSVVCSCVVCGRRFRASRTDAKYCGGACRKKASRDRVGQSKNPFRGQPSQMTLADLDGLLQEHMLFAIDHFSS